MSSAYPLVNRPSRVLHSGDVIPRAQHPARGPGDGTAAAASERGTDPVSVADNDSSETWPIETVGDENVQTRDGNVQARHFTRLPRRDGDRRRLDIWLAPALGWLPVRILQTEPNGMQIELLWRGKLQQPSASGTADASPQSIPDASQPDKP